MEGNCSIWNLSNQKLYYSLSRLSRIEICISDFDTYRIFPNKPPPHDILFKRDLLYRILSNERPLPNKRLAS